MTTTLSSVLRLLSVVLLLLGFNLQLSAATYSVTVPSSGTLTSGKLPVASSGTQLGTTSIGVSSSTNLAAPGILTSYSLTATNGVTVSSGTLSTTTPTWDWTTNSPTMTYTLTGNSTITVANVPAAGDTWRSVTVAADGTKTLAFSGITPTYPFGSPPSTIPNGTVTFDFRIIAGTVYGFYSQADLTANSNGLTISGATSGTATLKAAAVAGGTATLPNATGTVILSSSTPATGDILQYTSSGWETLPKGTSGYVLTAGASTNSWAAASGGSTFRNISANTEFFDDFINEATFNYPWSAVVANSGVVSSGGGTTTANRPGVLQFRTASTANAQCSLYTTRSGMFFGGGACTNEWAINLSNLPTGAEDYACSFGYGDDRTSTNHVDGVYFACLGSGVANWQAVTSNNSTRTTTDTGVAVAAGSWLKLTIAIDAAGANAIFYINGTACATNSANIPTTSARVTGPMAQLNKIAGTTQRTCDIDYFYFNQTFTSSR